VAWPTAGDSISSAATAMAARDERQWRRYRGGGREGVYQPGD